MSSKYRNYTKIKLVIVPQRVLIQQFIKVDIRVSIIINYSAQQRTGNPCERNVLYEVEGAELSYMQKRLPEFDQ